MSAEPLTEERMNNMAVAEIQRLRRGIERMLRDSDCGQDCATVYVRGYDNSQAECDCWKVKAWALLHNTPPPDHAARGHTSNEVE